MRIIVAFAEYDGQPGVDARCAVALGERVVAAGHRVELIALPVSSSKSPQQQALAAQLMPSDAYGDALWALNFPACLLRHRRRRIWFTHSRPFGIDPRAPAGTLRSLLFDGVDGDLEVHVASDAIAETLGFGPESIRGVPPVAEHMIVGEVAVSFAGAASLAPELARAHVDLASWFEARA
jgi:hypothetical protein